MAMKASISRLLPRGFTVRLLVSFLLIALLPTLLVGFATVTILQSFSGDDAAEHLSGHLQAAAARIALQLDRQTGPLRAAAHGSALARFVEASSTPHGPEPELAERVSEELGDLVRGQPQWLRLRLVDRSGSTLLQVDRARQAPQDDLPQAIDTGEQEALRVALSAGPGRSYVSPLLPAEEGGASAARLQLAAPVSGQGGGGGAVLLVDLPVAAVTGELALPPRLQGATLHLLDRSGRILRWPADPRRGEVQLLPAIQAGDTLPRTVADEVMRTDDGHLVQGSQAVFFATVSPAAAVLSSAAAPLRWSLAATAPRTVLRGSMGAAWIWYLGLALLLAVLAAAGGLVARRLIAPLHVLAGQADEIAGGAHGRRIEGTGGDVLARLAQSINTLAEQVQELREESEKRERDGARLLEIRTRQLATEAAELDELLENLSRGIVVLDPEGRVERSTQAACRLLGIDQARLHGCWLASFVPALEALLDRGEEGTATTAYRDGTLVLDVVPVRHKDGGIVRFVLTLDEGASAAGTAAPGGEVLRDFAAALNDSVVRPLGGMRTLLQALQRDAALPEDKRKHIARVTGELSRLAERLTPLAALAGDDATAAEALDAEAAIEAAIAEIRPRAEAQGVDIDLSGIAAGSDWIRADGARFHRLLRHLLDNALDELAGGGTLTLSASRNGERLELVVADSGGGIPEDRLPQIFEPFHSTRPGRAGLGLASVRRILRAHAAEVAVASAEGRGTRIRIRWPLAEAAIEA